jgi:hypothetical protein
MDNMVWRVEDLGPVVLVQNVRKIIRNPDLSKDYSA